MSFFKKDIHLTLVGMKVGASSSGVLWSSKHGSLAISLSDVLQCMVISLFVCMIFLRVDVKWQKEILYVIKTRVEKRTPYSLLPLDQCD